MAEISDGSVVVYTAKESRQYVFDKIKQHESIRIIANGIKEAIQKEEMSFTYLGILTDIEKAYLYSLGYDLPQHVDRVAQRYFGYVVGWSR